MRRAVLLLCAMRMVNAQSPASMRLEDFEQMALRASPALSQAQADVRAAAGRRQQAGLYPNPIIGYDGNEITPGVVIRGGEHGAFVEQRIVTGGKLGVAKRLAEQDQQLAETAVAAQRQRVLNQVRTLFYQALGEQRRIAVRTELVRLAREAVQTTTQLANVGQADRPDLLAIEIEAQRVELSLVQARNALDRTWRQLAAATGNRTLVPAPLDGDLEKLPVLEFDSELETIFRDSPEVRQAEVGISRSELAVRQARTAVTPDVVVRAGAHYNRELLELNQRPVGWQGSVELGIQLPLFNRNQGAIAAARAAAERATSDVQRTKLDLRSRLADAYREYLDARTAAERYRTDMIPRARQAYELYTANFRQMAAAYPQALIAQRNLFQLQDDYVTAMVSAWQRAVEIQGLLVSEPRDLRFSVMASEAPE